MRVFRIDLKLLAREFAKRGQAQRQQAGSDFGTGGGGTILNRTW